MHILLIHAYFLPPDAAGSVRWNETARHWAKAGHQVTVLCGTIDYLTGQPYRELKKEQAGYGIHVVRVTMSQHYGRGRWGRLWAYWQFFWYSLWAGLFRVDDSIDVVLATSPPLTAGLTGWLLARLRSRPFVLEIRDLWPDAAVQMRYLQNPLLIGMARWLERFLYQQAAHIVTLSAAFERVLVQQKDVVSSRCTTIPNGADFDLTEMALHQFDRSLFRQQHGLSDRFWIIYAGAHGRANGLDFLIDVADTMRHESVGFLLVGDGTEKAALQAEVSRRNLANVRFQPAMTKSAVLRWIAAADAGLVIMKPLPIFQTMLSAKLVDYLACAKPVLTAIDGETRWLAEQHQCGLFVEPTDSASWQAQICDYIANPRLALVHGVNGYQHARNTVDRATLAHRYLTVLNRVRAAN